MKEKVAVFFGVVQAVPHDELVWNGEAHIARMGFFRRLGLSVRVQIRMEAGLRTRSTSMR